MARCCVNTPSRPADPATVLTKLDGFFDLGLGKAHVERMLAGPLLHNHAKSPGESYDAQRRAEEKAVMRARLGADLERVVDWSYQACSGTPRGAPVLNSL